MEREVNELIFVKKIKLSSSNEYSYTNIDLDIPEIFEKDIYHLSNDTPRKVGILKNSNG